MVRNRKKLVDLTAVLYPLSYQCSILLSGEIASLFCCYSYCNFFFFACFSSFPLAPMAVTNPVVTPYPTSLCASWGPPVENGGSPINAYRLMLESSSDDMEQNVTVGGDTNFYTFEDLVANTNYT